MVNKKNKPLLILSLILSLFAVVFSVYFVSKIKESAKKSGASGNVALVFEPNEITTSLNTPLDLKIRVNPFTDSVTAVELHLFYDKNLMSIESITESSDFPTLLKSAVIDNNLGEATITLGVGADTVAHPVTSLTDLVNLSIKTKAAYGDATIKVDLASKVAVVGSDIDALGTYGETVVHVVDPNATSTSTSTSTATSTAVATSTSTANATATPIDEGTGGGGEPNSCNGTCGSNYNCKSNLYCYQGYCRNPFCNEDKSCGCTATDTPTETKAPIKKGGVVTNTISSTSSPSSQPKNTIRRTTTPRQLETPITIDDVILEDVKTPSSTKTAFYFIIGTLLVILVIGVLVYKSTKENL